MQKKSPKSVVSTAKWTVITGGEDLTQDKGRQDQTAEAGRGGKRNGLFRSKGHAFRMSQVVGEPFGTLSCKPAPDCSPEPR